MRVLYYTYVVFGCFGLTMLCTGCQQQKQQQQQQQQKQNAQHIALVDQQDTQKEKAEKEDEQAESEHFTQLKRLSWLIGTWEDVDKEDDMTIETINDWEERRNFIIQDFSVQKAGQEEMSGQQIIGWDPQAKQIRSWIFDTDGGFAEGVWRQHGENWVLDSVATLPDGRKASVTYLFSNIKPDRYTWEANDRQIGDTLLENVGPVEVMRKK